MRALAMARIEDEAVPGWQRQIAAVLVTVVVVMAAGLLAIGQYRPVSPLDEIAHFDTALKASEGRLWLPSSERLSQESMRLEACRGFGSKAFKPPPCGLAQYNPEKFQAEGYNTAAGRPSLYYPVTGYAARAISAVAGVDLLTAARVASLTGWALGAGLLAFLITRISRSAVVGGGAALAVAMLPLALGQAVTTNPDSWGLLVGTGVIGWVWSRHRHRPWVYGLVLAAALVAAVLIKQNFVILLVAPAVVAVWDACRARRWRELVPAGLAVAVAGAAFGATNLVTVVLSTPNTAFVGLNISPANPWLWTEVLRGTMNALLPTAGPTPTVPLAGAGLSMTAIVVFAALMAPVVIAMVSAKWTDRSWVFAVATLLTLLASPVLVFGGARLIGQFFSYPQRYGFVALPLVALVWGLQSPRRILPSAVLGGGLSLLVLGTLLT